LCGVDARALPELAARSPRAGVSPEETEIATEGLRAAGLPEDVGLASESKPRGSS
jgi:hypothetical protein